MNPWRVAALLVIVGLPAVAAAQGFIRTPLPSNHPLVGLWRIDLPKLNCFEEYQLQSDGTKLSRSADERNESEFMISLTPSVKGFYKWTDRITKNNGQRDCTGDTTAVGHVAVNYIRLHVSGERFLLCEAEDTKACFAEFFLKAR